MMWALDSRGQIIDMLATLGNPAGEIARPAHAAAGFAFHGESDDRFGKAKLPALYQGP
jgi:hypothetical protein